MSTEYLRTGLFASAAIVSAASSSAAFAQTIAFNLPPQEAAAGVSAFARQARVQMLIAARDARGRRTNEVRGQLPVQRALDKLLLGTGLTAKPTGTQTYTIIPTQFSARGAGLPPTIAVTLPAAVALPAAVDLPADAQQSAEPQQAVPTAAESRDDDIIVTARKRNETSIAVPVSLYAVGAAELERRAVTKLDDLSKIVPQLQIGEGGGGLQGGTITLRGLGSGDGSPLVDQSVSFVVDGISIARATVRRMSELDIQQIEVLKGPQALFFGKNSPGGIISVRSADPTSSLEAKLTAAYEFNADEIKAGGYISGPLTETIGARLALYGSRVNGDVENAIPKDHPLAPDHRSRPYDREYGGRLSLKWEPSDSFNARLKLSHGVTKTAGLANNVQFLFCGAGNINQYGNPYDDCKGNGKGFWANVDPAFAARDFRFRDGETYLRQKDTLASLELNYLPSDELTITSVSGWYQSRMLYADNPSPDITGRGLIAVVGINIQDYSQELRLTSDFDFPVNFTIGGLYSGTKGDSIIDAFVGLPSRVAGRSRVFIDGDAYSVFGQARWDISDTLELAGGARYSHEEKRAKYFLGRDPGIFDIPRSILRPKRTFSNVSPEATLTWRPTRRMTLFGAYRTGFLSGSYNANVTAAPDPSFEQQKTKGFEVGTKASLLDDALRVNLTAYDYVTTGLQVTITFIRPDGTPNSQIFNGGKMTSKGIEADFNYRTPLTGLSLHGAVGYNHSRYNNFTALCYRGQTIAAGCDQVLNPLTGAFTTQDLKGKQVVRAPDWNINGGAVYETPISGTMKLALSGDAAYTSEFFTDPRSQPGSIQKAYWLLDASINLINEGSGWEIGVVGKNLTNEYYTIRTTEATGGGTLPGLPTGSVADMIGSVSRGRQIMLRASLRYR